MKENELIEEIRVVRDKLDARYNENKEGFWADIAALEQKNQTLLVSLEAHTIHAGAS